MLNLLCQIDWQETSTSANMSVPWCVTFAALTASLADQNVNAVKVGIGHVLPRYYHASQTLIGRSSPLKAVALPTNNLPTIESFALINKSLSLMRVNSERLSLQISTTCRQHLTACCSQCNIQLVMTNDDVDLTTPAGALRYTKNAKFSQLKQIKNLTSWWLQLLAPTPLAAG